MALIYNTRANQPQKMGRFRQGTNKKGPEFTPSLSRFRDRRIAKKPYYGRIWVEGTMLHCGEVPTLFGV
jgi:hypothetical protein